jgi:hypothetical protein
MVDFPDAGRPVNQTVAPRTPSELQRRSRVSPPASQTTSGERSRPLASTIMPAPTVSLVVSSMRMKDPVVRLRL